MRETGLIILGVIICCFYKQSVEHTIKFHESWGNYISENQQKIAYILTLLFGVSLITFGTMAKLGIIKLR